jgi:hypothetical protein
VRIDLRKDLRKDLRADRSRRHAHREIVPAGCSHRTVASQVTVVKRLVGAHHPLDLVGKCLGETPCRTRCRMSRAGLRRPPTRAGAMPPASGATSRCSRPRRLATSQLPILTRQHAPPPRAHPAPQLVFRRSTAL